MFYFVYFVILFCCHYTEICGCCATKLGFSSSAQVAAKKQPTGNHQPLKSKPDKVRVKKRSKLKVVASSLPHHVTQDQADASKQVNEQVASASAISTSPQNVQQSHDARVSNKKHSSARANGREFTKEVVNSKERLAKSSTMFGQRSGKSVGNFEETGRNMDSGFLTSNKVQSKQNSSNIHKVTGNDVLMNLADFDVAESVIGSSHEHNESSWNEQSLGMYSLQDDFAMETRRNTDERQPTRLREGTIGGKLFEVRTMAEINGFLNLGNVSTIDQSLCTL